LKACLQNSTILTSRSIYIQNWDCCVPNTKHIYWDCCVPNTYIHISRIKFSGLWDMILKVNKTWFRRKYMFHYPNVTISLFTIKLKRLNVSISSLHIHNQIEKAECTITVYSHHKARKYTAVCRTNPKKNSKMSRIKYITISDICVLGSFNHHITS